METPWDSQEAHTVLQSKTKCGLKEQLMIYTSEEGLQGCVVGGAKENVLVRGIVLVGSDSSC